MAKIVKSTRDLVDVEQEVKKVTSKGKETPKKDDVKVKVKNDKKSKSKVRKEKKGIFNFFSEVKKEVSKVKWPSKKEMIKYTFATLGFVLFFSIFFYIIIVLMAMLKEII